MKNWKFTILTFMLIIFSNTTTFAQPTGFIDQEYAGTFDQAVGLTFDDNGRMYVYEKAGKVWIVENGELASSPMLDISEEVGNWRDFGMLGFVLDPNFLSNGYIYCLYIADRHHLLYYGTNNYDPNSNEYFNATVGRITRFKADASTNFTTIISGSRTVLLGESVSNDGFSSLHQSHGTGSLVFGTDGTLLASFGDGASYSSVDQGSANETYWSQAITDGLISSAQNIGAYRVQLNNNLAGKLIRIDPETGDGIPSNPFYQSNNPGSAQSKIFAKGLRNPCRMTLKPETGSHDPADGDPGVIYIGDVGWGSREELNVVDAPGLNFGWPKYEGMTHQPGYNNSNYEPSSHEFAKLDWRNGTARGSINGSIVNVGSGQLPGPNFTGNCSIGGVWYSANDFPTEWTNTYFHADYGGDWIMNYSFDANNNPIEIKNFKTGANAIVFITTDPIYGGLYYIAGASGGNPQVNNSVRRIEFTGGNLPPFVLASSDNTFGSSPLTVNFKGDLSYDPNGDAITYDWNFGDGNNSAEANPSHTFSAGGSQPTSFTVTLTVSDGNLSEQKTLNISLNNTPPQILSTSIDGTNTFSSSNGATLSLNANVTDSEHSNNQLTYEWFTELHHNNHFHAEAADNNPSTSVELSPVGCDGSTYFYRIKLKVTDPAGLFSIYQKDIYPNCSGTNQTISFNSISDKVNIDPPIQLTGSASSGLPIIFHVISGPATISGSTLTLNGTPGVVIVRAIQSGNDTYAPAIPVEHTFIVNPAGGTGLTGNYFNNIDLTNQVLTRVDPNIDFDWGTGSPDPSIGVNTFSVRWDGGILPLYNENYTFTLTGDDGIRLWVDNQLIIDQWVDQSPTDHSGNLTLSVGVQVPIRVEYYENGGGAVAKLRWSSNSQVQQIIPQFLLFPEYIAPDTDPPNLSLSTASNNVDGPFIVNVNFDEEIIGLNSGDFNISNGNATGLTGSEANYSFTVTPINDGNVSIQLPADIVEDAAENGNNASNILNVNYEAPNVDNTPPTFILSTVSNIVDGPFEVRATFSESASSLVYTDFIVTNGIALNDLSVVGDTYYFSIDPSVNGNVTIQLPADIVQDAAGNGNIASNILIVNYEVPNVDNIPPTFLLSTISNIVDGPFEVRATFSEPVSSLVYTDFVVTNGVAINDLSVVGDTYYFSIDPSANGDVTIQLPADIVQDAAGNGNIASNILIVNYEVPNVDNIPPTFLLSTISNIVDGPFEVRATFSEPVSSLVYTDFIVTNGVAINDLSVVGDTYYFSIDPSANGDVTIQLPADIVQDAAGNGNIASNILIVNYEVPNVDNTPPTFILSTISNIVDGPFEVRATFSEPVSNLVYTDFVVTNGVAINDLSVVGDTYYFSIDPSANGNVTIQLPADIVQDAAGNENIASNILIVNYEVPNVDNIPPTFTLSTVSNNVDGPFEIRATFSEPASSLIYTDFIVTNGVALNDLSVVGDTYYFSIDPSANGNVSIQLPADIVQDAAGNGNIASNILIVNYNSSSSPTVTIISPSEGSSITGTEVIINFQTSGDLAGNNAEHLLLTLNGNTPIDIHDIETGGTYTLTDVPAGTHTVLAQLADNSHVPVNLPGSEDEVNFTTVENVGGNSSSFILPETEKRGMDAILYPNPVEDYIIVKYETNKAGLLNYIITNAQGVILKEDKFEVEKGDGTFTTEVKQWPAGHYIFYIKIDGYRTKQIQFIRIRD